MPQGLSRSPRCWISWRRQNRFWMTFRKVLNDYLVKKRLFFSRFLSQCSNDLSGILSETKDPLHVQPHLKKCFEGIAKLTFNHEKEITHMESAENEKVELVLRIIPASAKGLVEQWLHEVNIFSSYLGFSYCIIIFSFRSNEYHKHIS